ncbi:hypothetical protein BC826DRAFT_1110390 [Russula brevipes]|nr:hypothetical protein BC826DRAFT_1110390 [Russula brevipes]
MRRPRRRPDLPQPTKTLAGAANPKRRPRTPLAEPRVDRKVPRTPAALDTDAPAPLTLETLAADMISRLNENRTRPRGTAEVGGSDTSRASRHSRIPARCSPPTRSPHTGAGAARALARVRAPARPVAEEPPFANDWEVDPEAHLHPDGAESDVDADLDADADVDGSTTASPLKDSFIGFPPPPRLTSLSEHAQVNGAATTEAGRKLRALKNKLGGWRTDWDSAERSRARIERWETGGDIEGARRVDGRAVVAEHLRDFERVLFEANVKTQAIMAPA